MLQETQGIAYRLMRSRVRRTADIVIERDGRVVVRVPEKLNAAKVDALILSRQRWIHTQLAKWRVLNASRVAREFKSGESFFYLGRNYRLQVVAGQEAPLLLKDGRFCLLRGVAHGVPDAARAVFRDFYVAKGQARLVERVAYYAPKVGVRPIACKVTDLAHRWASCTAKGQLRFHWKCMMAPLTVIDYLVVHELCHLRHRDHDEAFWNEVDKVLPDFRQRKEWLERFGAGLDV